MTTELTKEIRDELENYYISNSYLRGLIQLLPVASAIDTILSNYIYKRQAEKLRTFFDKLNNGDVVLEMTDLENNDFLHAYFSTMNYVLTARTDEKVERFAEILKAVYTKKINIEQFFMFASSQTIQVKITIASQIGHIQ